MVPEDRADRAPGSARQAECDPAAPGASETSGTDGIPNEEIRFAVILNGGVSLAVWMGGTVLELDRLTRERGPYRALLGMVRSTARADVISGTSAGGINGAFLAMSQINEQAKTSMLREVWADQGRMETLLREPFSGSPPSLLRGDEYFLPKLQEAIAKLAEPIEGIVDRPIDLTITTTLLHGARTVTVDAMGSQLLQSVHEGRFNFVQGVDADGKTRRDFDRNAITATAARLGLAARSTASFPMAFEPSFLPVTSTDVGSRPLAQTEDPGRPDMGGVVSWRREGTTGDGPADRSRFVVDGGLLVNTPTRAALQAVDRLPAEDPVRRVALLIYPNTVAAKPDEPDKRDGMPTVLATGLSLLGALTSQASRTFVEEVEAHNKRAGAQRAGRADLLAATKGAPTQLRDLARALFPHYRALRRRRVARDLPSKRRYHANWSYERIRTHLDAAQEVWAKEHEDAALPPQLPYLPDDRPGTASLEVVISGPAQGWGWGLTAAEGIAGAALDLLKRLIWELEGPQVDVCKRARKRVHEARAQLRRARHLTDDRWDEEPLSKLQPDGAYWRLRLAAFQYLMLDIPDGSAKKELEEACKVIASERTRPRTTHDLDENDRKRVRDAVRTILREDPGSVGRQVRKAVDDVVCAVRMIVPSFAGVTMEEGWGKDLKPWYELLTHRVPTNETSADEVILTRLLDLEIVTFSLTDEVSTGAEYPIDLVQLSLQTRNAFAEHSRSAEDKLGGETLNRFGGFLKQSWRVNDWIWGRLDAASILCRLVLDPQRLRRAVEHGDDAIRLKTAREADKANGVNPAEGEDGEVRQFAEDVVDVFVEELFGSRGPSLDFFAGMRGEAVSELASIYAAEDSRLDLPIAAPNLADLAAWALHLRIAAEELPALARAVLADRADGANPRSRGELFLEQEAELLTQLEILPPEGSDDADQLRLRLNLGFKALRAFDRAGIGREPLSDESGSDQLIRTVTTAAGVAVTLADSDKLGFKPVKPITRTARGAALLPYWSILGLTRGGAAARSLSLLAFALGGAVVALAVLGAIPLEGLSGVIAAAGLGVVLGAFGYSALRTGHILHGAVLLTPLVPLLAYALNRPSPEEATEEASRQATGATGTVIAVLVIVLALVVLGSLPSARRSPIAAMLAALDRVGDTAGWPPGGAARRGRAARLVALKAMGWLVVLALVATVVWALVDRAPAWLGDNRGLAVVVTAGLAVVGLVVAYLGGRSLQLWQRAKDGWAATWVNHPAGVTANWAWVYGVLYLLAGTALIRWTVSWMDGWQDTAAAVCFLIAAILLLVVPVLAVWGARRGVRRRLLNDVNSLTYPESWRAVELTSELIGRELLERLATLGLTYRYLVGPSDNQSSHPSGDQTLVGPSDAETLELKKAGKRTRDAVQGHLKALKGRGQ